MGLICCRMAVKRMGMLGLNVRKITVQMEMVQLVGKGI